MRGHNLAGAYVVYSDDMGLTWQLLGGDVTVQACSGSDEPKVEELPDGSIVLSGRKWHGRCFNIFTFTDLVAAKGSWGTAVDSRSQAGGISVGANSCNGELLFVDAVRTSDGARSRLALQSLPFGEGRFDVGFYWKDITSPSAYQRASVNDAAVFAQNWTRGLQVSHTISAYSTMCLQADGRIAFFFEEGPGEYDMVYVPLTISEITEGAYE